MKSYTFFEEANDAGHSFEQVISSPTFKQGVGLIETMRVKNGVIPLWKQHYARLIKSAKQIGFPNIEEQTLIDFLLQLVQNSTFLNARLRLQTSIDHLGKVFHVVEIEKAENESFVLNDEGIQLGLYINNYKAHSPLSNLKSSNYLLFHQASQHAKQKGYDQVILVNGFGHVAETNIANVFVVKDDVVYTPGLDSGCVDGVMRKMLLQFFNDKSIDVNQEPFIFEFFNDADAVFVSNAYRGVVWVKEFMGKEFEKYEHLDMLVEYLNKYSSK